MTTAAAPAARRGPATVEILRLRIELEDIRPTVWRSVLIRASSPLSTLHTVVQEAMGWYDCHLHEFAKDGVRYGPHGRLEDDPDLGSERKQLGTLFRGGVPVLGYLYDFGDSWHHRITVDERLPADLSMRRPRCVGGENACPPEARSVSARRQVAGSWPSDASPRRRGGAHRQLTRQERNSLTVRSANTGLRIVNDAGGGSYQALINAASAETYGS